MNVVLFEPEIPPNTGSVARLCAATRSPLHLIEPLGFQLDDKHLKRAGLDYWPHVDLRVHGSWRQFLRRHGEGRMFFFSRKAARSYVTARYREADFLVFGPETRGLPESLLNAHEAQSYLIPMMSPAVRSLNLANAVSIVLYEGLRQLGQLEPRVDANVGDADADDFLRLR